jgi:cytochrome o ubiquinol oxidase subunit IV
MSFSAPTQDRDHMDSSPGDQRLEGTEIGEAMRSYLVGLGLASLLTIASFVTSGTTLVWGPSIPVALVVLAIAQMGVHLVFFLHITTGPDNVNNVMALAFGVLIVLLLLIGSLWIMGNLNQNMRSMDEFMRPQVQQGSGARTVTARVVVGPYKTAPVHAPVSGLIQAVECDVDMQIKAGQICARIDPRPYQIALDQSKASLQKAQSLLETDKADFDRAKRALEKHEAQAKRGASSKKAIDRSRKSFERVQTRTSRDVARVADLEEAVNIAETNLASTDIVSPLDGTVLSRNVEPRQTVTADAEAAPLFVIAEDLSLIKIDVVVSAKDASEVKLGDKATFTVEEFPNRLFYGIVTQNQRLPQNSENVSNYHIVISVPNPDLLLKPGMTANMTIAIQ